MARFTGKTVLITGGTSGIGLATARRIVDEGGTVGLTGAGEAHIAEAAAVLPDAKILQNDASDPAAAEALADWAKAEFGAIDAAFLNAGLGGFFDQDETSEADWDRLMNINGRAPYLQSRHLGPVIRDGGALAITGSVSAYRGMAKAAAYGATKGAVRSMTRSLASHFAPRGIRVNCVTPGPIQTNFGRELPEAERASFEERIGKATLIGRLGRAEEVAAVACFLLSDEASYVTGSEYIVDGGATLH